MTAPRSQRWRERREAFVAAGDVINPADYAVDVLAQPAAKQFVELHHYSGTFPAARLSVGLFRGRQLVGCATFSVPMNDAAIPKHTGLQGRLDAVDLGRFVLLDDVPGNGETWFLARAARILRREKPEVQAFVSYADPMPRVGPAGELIKPGHIGEIYQASSAQFRGRAKPRLEFLTPDGQLFSERALSKIRRGEQGQAYAVDQLVRRGAPRPTSDDLAGWLRELQASDFLQRRKHPGAYVYAFPLTRKAKGAARRLPAAGNYPRAVDVDQLAA